MKTVFCFLILTLLISVFIGSASATVFRVNNSLTENITGRLFSNIQTANDHFSVKSGDTLMVESSGKGYEGFNCTKRLIIIGPGYFLGENPSVNGVVASAHIIGSIDFRDGSQESYFIGMESDYSLQVSVNNIYFVRCNIPKIYFYYVSNCKIVASFIGSINNFKTGAGISVTNCIIQNDYSDIAYVTYENNILVSKSSTWKISSGTFRNNILIERDVKVEIKSPNIQNNLAPNEQFGTANGNRAYQPSDLFVGGTSTDGKYRIKADSPYIAAGYSGTQPGIFGGSEPYVLSGIPPVPIIYELNVPGTGSAASGLNINVKIRGAN